ncbi:MAG: hypothetical protein P8Z79_19470 [Sedimentisphaerales bacterium]
MKTAHAYYGGACGDVLATGPVVIGGADDPAAYLDLVGQLCYPRATRSLMSMVIEPDLYVCSIALTISNQ